MNRIPLTAPLILVRHRACMTFTSAASKSKGSLHAGSTKAGGKTPLTSTKTPSVYVGPPYTQAIMYRFPPRVSYLNTLKSPLSAAAAVALTPHDTSDNNVQHQFILKLLGSSSASSSFVLTTTAQTPIQVCTQTESTGLCTWLPVHFDIVCVLKLIFYCVGHAAKHGRHDRGRCRMEYCHWRGSR